MSRSVFCIATLNQGNKIIERLQVAGFSTNDISVLMADKQGTRDFALEHHTKAPEGAVVGAGTGVAVGGIVGWLAGIGTLAIPGLGPLIASGPILAALSGAAVGGTAGGIVGALVGLGIPELEAKRFEGKVKTGGVLISVHSENCDQTKSAQEIFENAGAEDITTTEEAAAPIHRQR
jgi:hypothetical protein